MTTGRWTYSRTAYVLLVLVCGAVSYARWLETWKRLELYLFSWRLSLIGWKKLKRRCTDQVIWLSM